MRHQNYASALMRPLFLMLSALLILRRGLAKGGMGATHEMRRAAAHP